MNYLTISGFWPDPFPFNPRAIFRFVLYHNRTRNSHLGDATRLLTCCPGYRFHIPLIFLVSKNRNLTPLFSLPMQQEYCPYSPSNTASRFSFLFETNYFHRISLKFPSQYLYYTGVYNFIKETVRHVYKESQDCLHVQCWSFHNSFPHFSYSFPSVIHPNLASLHQTPKVLLDCSLHS